MHKLLLAFTLLLVLAFTVTAQTDIYNFSRSTATYTSLTQGQKISTLNFPDITQQFTIALPFPFKIFDATFSSCAIASGGDVFFPNTSAPVLKQIAPMGCSFKKKDNTTGVFAQIDGTAGNRIYKIEYRQMGLNNSTPDDFINFQAWLYEGVNAVEFRYGPHTNFSVLSYLNQKGPFIGIIEFTQSSSESSDSYYLVGDSASPVFRTDKPGLFDTYVKGNIAPNTVYTFSRKDSPLSVKGNPVLAKPLVTVYPNPSNAGAITIVTGASQNPVTVTIKDLQGKTLITKQIAADGTETTIEPNALAPGMYLLIAQDISGSITTQKIVIN